MKINQGLAWFVLCLIWGNVWLAWWQGNLLQQGIDGLAGPLGAGVQPATESLVLAPSQQDVGATDSDQCLSLGPFPNPSRMAKVQKQLALEGGWRVEAREQKKLAGYRLQSQVFASRQDAEYWHQQLMRAGISNYFAEDPRILTLGVFVVQANAERLQQRLQDWPFSIHIQPHQQTQKQYWFEHQHLSYQDKLTWQRQVLPATLPELRWLPCAE